MAESAEPKPSVRIKLEGEALSPTLRKMRQFSATIDAEDEELVQSLGPWHVTGPDRRGYYDWRSHTPYAYCQGKPSDDSWSALVAAPTMYLHDLIMGVGADEEAFPANGNGLDCRKSNLRVRKKPKQQR